MEREDSKWFVGMFTGVFILVLVVIIALWYAVFSIKIPVWYVGIKVNMYWDDKWVSVYTLKTGRNWYNPINSDVYRYPTFVQQKNYENISFQDNDWLVIASDIWLDYQFKEDKVSYIFEQYRADIYKITDVLMATWLKSSVNKASAEFKVDELYWPKKEQFRIKVLEYIKKDFDEKGIVVWNIYFIWDMKLPDAVSEIIKAKISATQAAMQKENELRTVEAEAQKKIAEAKGNATAAIAVAEGKSQATLIEAKAEAEAIKIKSQAITAQWWAEYVKLKEIEKWNWMLPQITWVNSVVATWLNLAK